LLGKVGFFRGGPLDDRSLDDAADEVGDGTTAADEYRPVTVFIFTGWPDDNMKEE
jgi:hypothetical protein